MDTNLAFAHGAFSFLQEKLYTTTDPSNDVTCRYCHNTAYLDKNTQQYVCTSCQDQSEFIRLCTPRSLDLLRLYWRALSIKSELNIGIAEDSVSVTKRLMERK